MADSNRGGHSSADVFDKKPERVYECAASQPPGKPHIHFDSGLWGVTCFNDIPRVGLDPELRGAAYRHAGALNHERAKVQLVALAKKWLAAYDVEP